MAGTGAKKILVELEPEIWVPVPQPWSKQLNSHHMNSIHQQLERNILHHK